MGCRSKSFRIQFFRTAVIIPRHKVCPFCPCLPLGGYPGKMIHFPALFAISTFAQCHQLTRTRSSYRTVLPETVFPSSVLILCRIHITPHHIDVFIPRIKLAILSLCSPYPNQIVDSFFLKIIENINP